MNGVGSESDDSLPQRMNWVRPSRYDLNQLNTAPNPLGSGQCCCKLYQLLYSAKKPKEWSLIQLFTMELEMWANAQRDGRPAEYRWRPLFTAAKFG